MGKFIDITGIKFNRLTAIEYLKGSRNNLGKWKCICDCGKIVLVDSYAIKNSHTKSCGCLNAENAGENNYKNGLYKHRIRNVWNGMKARCYNINSEKYYRYGGRGITVCDEWKNDLKCFYDWALKNGYRKDLSIDRIDNDGNYEPENCKWSTCIEQSSNTSRNVRFEYFGKLLTVPEISRLTGIKSQTIWTRLKRVNDIYTAVDTGGAIKGNKIDLFLGGNSYQECLKFGRVKAKLEVLK